MSKIIIAVLIFSLILSCKEKSAHTENIIGDSTLVVTKISSVDSAVALKFMNEYIENENLQMKGEGLELVKWVNENPFATQSLKTELQKILDKAYKIEPEIGLGFDPVLDAQDFPEEGFELENIDHKTGYVTLAGKQWKEFKVRMRLIESDGKWLVDGVGIINVPESQRAPR